jgi:hypothetical protein
VFSEGEAWRALEKPVADAEARAEDLAEQLEEAEEMVGVE